LVDLIYQKKPHMTRLYTLSFLLFALISCQSLMAQSVDSRYVDGKLYLRLRVADSTFSLSNPVMLPLVAWCHMDTCYRPFAGLGNDTLDRTFCLKFSDTAKTSRCIDTLRSLPLMEMVEQVPVFHTSYVPNDLNSNQYGLLKISAEPAWSISRGSASIVLAIVDNAILSTHQDLAANMVAGYDVADNDNNTAPPAGFISSEWNHGTHTSGIASAVTDNGTGIASIGFNTKLMPIKCTPDSNKNGDLIMYADEGISYAMRSGAKIISMSFGSYQSSLTEQILINTAINQGIVMVAAAGNSDTNTLFYPASYTGVISVGATDQNDMKASFSNYGSRIDVMAPGVNIYSTIATSASAYTSYSGTSMACPLVAGLAGLVLAHHPTFTPAQVTSAIKNSADNISAQNPNYAGQLGAGRINAYHALGGTGTGLNDLTGDLSIVSYPNPFAESIVVKNSRGEKGQIELIDMDGRVLVSQEMYRQNTRLSTSPLPAGLYILRVSTAHGIYSSKMCKL
jgi:subtilisin family serine protease